MSNTNLKNFNFEAALAELDEITAWFEGTEINLDQSLAKFERGLELSAALQEHLHTIENKVERIKARFDTPSSDTHDLLDADK